MDGFTTKQRVFVEAYLGEAKFNATEAARIAGYQGNDQTLAVVGFENLRKPKIAALVSERINEAAMSANEVLARLSRHARGSLLDLLDESGEFDMDGAKERGVDDLLKKLKRKVHTHRTKDGEEDETVTHEFEIHDPQAALVHLGRFHKLFTDKTDLTSNGQEILTHVTVVVKK